MAGEKVEDLTGVLKQLDRAPDGSRTSFGELLEAAGRRSFGPLLLVPGLLVMSPLGGIPGMATSVGVVSLLVSLQLLAGRRSFWLPQWVLSRKVSSERVRRAIKALRRPARWVDRLLKPRLQWMLRKPALQMITLGCVAVSVAMPVLEIVPFADTAPGAALTALGLGLISDDGFFALISALLCAVTLCIAGYALLG